MDIGSSFVADTESSVLVEPCEGAFDDSAASAEAAAVFGVAFGEQTLDAEGFERVAMGLRIVSAVALHEFGSSAWAAALAAHGRDGLDQRQQLGDVVGVGARQGDRQGDALRVGQDVMLATAFAPVCRVWARFEPPKRARTDALSTTVWDQSIPSDWCRWASMASNTLSQTPASCQSLRRRQHVTPLPQPISCGRYDQEFPFA